MSIEQVKKPVHKIINQSESYPYIPTTQLTGISIVNDGNDTVTVVVNDGERDITINCTINGRTYNGDFKAIKSINVTAGTTYQIELRSVL